MCILFPRWKRLLGQAYAFRANIEIEARIKQSIATMLLNWFQLRFQAVTVTSGPLLRCYEALFLTARRFVAYALYCLSP